LREHGFTSGNYKKIIVTWGWTDDAKREADAAAIELWDFREVVSHIAAAIQDETRYFADDTLRTLGLYTKAIGELKQTPIRTSRANTKVP
jgi:hypothetical protein